MAQITGQQHEMEGVSGRVQRLENDLRKQTELVEQFKAVQNWNGEELQRWADAALQKEEDALTLALYQRQDEAKVKELSRQLERCSGGKGWGWWVDEGPSVYSVDVVSQEGVWARQAGELALLL